MRIAPITVVLLLAIVFAFSATAQPFPVSGQIYLSFLPDSQLSTLDVTPGVPFQMWITVDIPAVLADPDLGITGVEGGISFPPSVELMSIEFPSPALNLGPSFPEPNLESFIVGLGQCLPLGAPTALGVVWARLLAPGTDIEIAVDAPGIGAAGVSSFAGIGPGWASLNCEDGGTIDLVLFDAPSTATSSVILNSTTVSVERGSFAKVKSLY